MLQAMLYCYNYIISFSQMVNVMKHCNIKWAHVAELNPAPQDRIAHLSVFHDELKCVLIEICFVRELSTFG